MNYESENSHQTQMTRLVIIKNVSVLSFGAMLHSTAYIGLAMIQSTMNREQGIGLISQAIVNGGFCVSCLLLPKYVLTKLGSKNTFVLSMLTHVAYIASNFYPHWGLMIPSSICTGVGASLLWGSQANYLNDIAVMYASLSSKKKYDKVSTVECETDYSTLLKTDDSPKKTDLTNLAQGENHGLSEMNYNGQTIASNCDNSNQGDHTKIELHQEKVSITSVIQENNVGVKRDPNILQSTTALFFGFHGMAYQSSLIWTNLITYFVLKRGSSESFSNVTCICGADFCNVESECFVNNVDSPGDSTRYLLCGVCTSLGLLSVLAVVFFLDPLETKKKEVRFSVDLMFATCKIMKKKELMLLIPASFYLGLSRGFYTADITKSYIGCAWGTLHVGLVTVFYGVSSGLSSSLSGWLVKRLGRPPVFSAAAALNLAACIFLLLWSPDRRDTAMFFLAAVLWGAPSGILWAQYRALFGTLFKADEEAAFAAYHAWYSLGFCLSFVYSNYLCTNVKIYVMLIVSTVGYIGYILVERIQRKNSSSDSLK